MKHLRIGNRAWSIGGTPSEELWNAKWIVRAITPLWLRKKGIIILRYDKK